MRINFFTVTHKSLFLYSVLFLSLLATKGLKAQVKAVLNEKQRGEIRVGIESNPDSMLSVLRPMLNEYKEDNNAHGQAQIAYYLGDIYRSRFLYDSMYHYLDFCLSNTQERDLRFAALQRLAIFFHEKKEIDLSQKYCYELLDFHDYSEADARKLLTLTRLIISNWEYNSKQPDSTIYWVNYAMQLQEKFLPDLKVEKQILRFHYASALRDKGEFLKAFEIYLETRDFLIENNIKLPASNYAIYYNNLAKTTTALNLNSQSETYIDSCIQIIDSGIPTKEYFHLINDVYSLASTIYSLNNKGKKVIEIQKRHLILKDSIMKWKRHDLTIEAQVRYNTTNHELNNKLLNSQLDEQTQQKNIYIILSVSLSLIVGLVTFIFIQNRSKLKYKEQKALQNEELAKVQSEANASVLKEKEKELENKALKISLQEEKIKQERVKASMQERQLSSIVTEALRRSEQVNYISERLKEAKKKPSLITNILKEIKSFQSSEQEWEKMKVHFEDVHKGFFEKVLNKTPNLTRLNLRMCVYMRMNLSDKEIALLTASNPHAIEVRRYRLRKQMGFENNKALVDYLRSV